MSETECRWVEPWVGPCGFAAVSGGFCESHAKRKCVVCGEQAVGICISASSLMCGNPLCGKHSCPLHACAPYRPENEVRS